MSVAVRAWAVLALTACVVVPSPVAAAEPAVSGTAVESFGACLTGRLQADVLVLLDQSASLQRTDPAAVRVQAATYLLEQLRQTAERVGADVDVAVAGFDQTYQRTVDWRRVDASTVSEMTGQLEAFRGRDEGFDTDYVHALAGAQSDLRSQRRGQAQPGCQAIVWLSDGQFDLEPRLTRAAADRFGRSKPYAPGADLRTKDGAAAAEQQGIDALCRVGGTTDQLRDEGVLTFAVGLGQADFDLMGAIATGGRGSHRCGRPSQDPVGELRLASDVDALAYALNGLAGLVAPSEQRMTGCDGTACSEGTQAFVLDASVREVDVLAGTDGARVDVLVDPPSAGPPVRLPFAGTDPFELTVDGQRLHGRWLSDHQVHLSLVRRDTGPWTGRWALTYVAPPASAPVGVRSQLRLTADLLPRWLRPSESLHASLSTAMAFGIASESTGETVTPQAALGTVRVSASLIDSSGARTQLVQDASPEAAARGITADLSQTPLGAATLRLALRARTGGTSVRGVAVPGTQLPDRTVDLPVTVRAPLEFPSASSHVDLGRTEGPGPTSARLSVTGPGCAWLADSSVRTGPQDVAVAITSSADGPGTCVRLARGEKGSLPLQVGLSGAANGTATGQLSVRLAPLDAPARALPFPVTFVGDFARPADKPVLYSVFLLAMMAAVGLPLLALYASKWWTAKIPSGNGLRIATFDVVVTAGDVLRNGTPLVASPEDTRFVAMAPRGSRRLEVFGALLRTRTGWSPIGGAFTLVSSVGHRVVTSGGRDRLPLAVHGSWFVLFPAAAAGAGQLVLLLPALGGPEHYRRMVDDVRARLPRLALDVCEDDSGSSSPPTPRLAEGWAGRRASAVPDTGALPAVTPPAAWGTTRPADARPGSWRSRSSGSP